MYRSEFSLSIFTSNYSKSNNNTHQQQHREWIMVVREKVKIEYYLLESNVKNWLI